MAGNAQGFDEVLRKVEVFVEVSGKVGKDIKHEHVKSQADRTKEAFQAQNQFLKAASGKAKPSEADISTMLKPTCDKIAAVQELQKKNPKSEHLCSVSEAVAALGWVQMSKNPAETIKQVIDSTKFYTNRVLKDFKKDNPVHGEWVVALIDVLTELENVVKKHYSNGVTWKR